MTSQTMRVLAAMLDEPTHLYYGLDLTKRTGLATGTLYPILARLEDAGWLTSSWEEIDERVEGRRRRRLYRLTGVGIDNARRELSQHAAGLGLIPNFGGSW